MAALLEHMQEIRMLLLLLWHFVKLLLTTRLRASHCGIRCLNIDNKYGYYKEDLFTMTFKGADGAKKMQDMMDAYRKNTPKQVGAYKVLRLRDYKNDVITDLATGETTPTGLPKSNVLYFELENDAWFCVRPSGTEPKIKFYAGIKGTSLEDSAKKLDELMEAIRNA